MPIIKKNDVTPERPVILVIYGTPGSGKTSVATTAANPILIDTDRGYDRAAKRVDTLVANDWKDICDAKNDLKSYSTVIIDTAKAMLDDYLSAFAVSKNSKLAYNNLKRFGMMADDFKAFVNELRANATDIIFVCHDKGVMENDVTYHSPDCTGQSKDLLLRIADQVGYVCVTPNKMRTVSFDPADNYVGKNVAQLPAMTIPDASTPEFTTFMADIIAKVKKSIQSKSEAQREASEMVARLREQLASVTTEDDAQALMAECAKLPQALKVPFFGEMKKALAQKGFEYKNKKFTLKEQTDNDK